MAVVNYSVCAIKGLHYLLAGKVAVLNGSNFICSVLISLINSSWVGRIYFSFHPTLLQEYNFGSFFMCRPSWECWVYGSTNSVLLLCFIRDVIYFVILPKIYLIYICVAHAFVCRLVLIFNRLKAHYCVYYFVSILLLSVTSQRNCFLIWLSATQILLRSLYFFIWTLTLQWDQSADVRYFSLVLGKFLLPYLFVCNSDTCSYIPKEKTNM
jgi:hypothetical protein